MKAEGGEWMIRDRGRMKWVSMMLPEHVKVLREWAEEDSYKVRKELDEQQLELMDGMIAEAMRLGRGVTVTYYRHKHYELLTGWIVNWDALTACLQLTDTSGGEYRLQLQDIMDIQWAE
jgi:hypothetical protein